MANQVLLAQVGTAIHLVAVVGIAVGAALVLGAFWAWHAAVLRAARRELEAYKAAVIGLSDQIDALKERHKLLPFMDQDFSVPLAGETLAAYNAVADQLTRHRGEWLKLMDAWEQAQALVESEWWLGRRRARDARRQIRAAAVAEALAALQRDCLAPLDRLGQAHELVAARSNSFADQNQQFQAQQQALKAESLAIDAYQREWAASQQLVEQAKAAVPADPLAALRCLDEAHAKLSQQSERATKILEHARAAREAAERIAQVADLARQRRNQGFYLREAEADPDPRLAQAQSQLAVAWQLMNTAEPLPAGEAVAKAAASVHSAERGIEQHVAARTKCESEIPARHVEGRRLAELHLAALDQRQELERDFAPEAWLAVANNAADAKGLLASALQLIEQATREAAANVQNYLQADRLVAQAARCQVQAEESLVAVSKRLTELVKIRGAFQSQFSQVLTQADGVGRLLRSSTADRVPANERFRTASALFQRVAEESRLPRPDWALLAGRLDEIQSDLKRAEKLAREDAKLAEQAAAEIAETETVIGQARGFSEWDFRADVSAADAQLSQARLRMAAQEYEEAIRLANAAEQAAREAQNQARMLARRRQAEIEAQRQAAAAAQARAFLSQPSVLPAEAEEPPARQSLMI